MRYEKLKFKKCSKQKSKISMDFYNNNEMVDSFRITWIEDKNGIQKINDLKKMTIDEIIIFSQSYKSYSSNNLEEERIDKFVKFLRKNRNNYFLINISYLPCDCYRNNFNKINNNNNYKYTSFKDNKRRFNK